VAVGAPELRVHIHHRLDDVVAGGDVAEVLDRRAEVHVIDNGRAAGRKPLDVAAEERRAGAADLQARLAVAAGWARDHHVDAAGYRRRVRGRRKCDLETQGRRFLCCRLLRRAGGNRDGHREHGKAGRDHREQA